MKFSKAKSWLPPGRVWALALFAAVLAFEDGQYLVTHLRPAGIWALLIRPALFLGEILCLSAIYVEGAVPIGPWGRVRWRTGMRVAVSVMIAVGVGQEILSLLEPFQPEIKVVSWSSSTERGISSSGLLRYPVFADGIEVAAFVAANVLLFSLAAIVLLGIFAPAIAMRSGLKGMAGQSWRAIRKHWLTIVIRAIALVPIGLIGMPIFAYWHVNDWALDGGTPPERIRQMQLAIEMCQQIGVYGIAYSAFAVTALFALFLWWIGRSTGVLLDREE